MATRSSGRFQRAVKRYRHGGEDGIAAYVASVVAAEPGSTDDPWMPRLIPPTPESESIGRASSWWATWVAADRLWRTGGRESNQGAAGIGGFRLSYCRCVVRLPVPP